VWCQPGNTLAAVGVIWRLTRYSYGGDSHRIQNVGVAFGKLKNNKITYRYRLFLIFLITKRLVRLLLLLLFALPLSPPAHYITILCRWGSQSEFYGHEAGRCEQY